MSPTTGPDPFIGFVDAAAQEREVVHRAARRELTDRAGELATWAGTLQDLAERHASVAVQLGSGRCHRGRLRAVARDHLVLVGDGVVTVLVAMPAVRSVRAGTALGRTVPQGDRPPVEDRTLLEALEDLLTHDPEVVMGLRGVPDVVRGRVERLGEDVVTLRTADGGAQVVPDTAVADVAWGQR